VLLILRLTFWNLKLDSMLEIAINFHFEKKGCFATRLAIHCISTLWPSQYLARLEIKQLIIYMTIHQCNSLQLNPNNFFSITMQLPYNYNHNVMLTSLFIHLSKSNAWHFEDFSMNLFWNIDIHYPLWLLILDGFKLWNMA
jgi:hypothetical protein